MNPYEVTSALPTRSHAGRQVYVKGTLLVATGFYVLAVILAVLELYIPAVRSFTMPRFGGYLIASLFVIPVLVTAIRKPTLSNLLAVVLMSMSIGFISAIPLLEFGTVSVIQDEVGSRLHSSWLWGVIPHFVLSGILMLAAWKMRRLG